MPLSLGLCVITPPASSALGHCPRRIAELLARHRAGDDGDLDDHDRRANAHAREHGERVLSAYDLGGVAVWVITEADRSCTTVLLPSDY